MKVRTTLSVFLLLGLVSAAPAQQPAPTEKPPEKCLVAGQVVKAGTGEPLKKARVTLRKEQSRESPRTEITDAQGRFTFKDVEPGRYRLFAARNAYAQQEYGQRAPNRPGTILTLAPGQQVKDVAFRLPPAAVIAGKVYDADGEAVAGVMVQVLQHRYIQGRRQLAPAGQAATDDRGEYRVFGLPAGRFYVSATYRPGLGAFFFGGGFFGGAGPGGQAPDETYVPTYYPGTNEPGRATPVELRAGNELTNIDFLLLPARAVRVRGRVYNAVTGKAGRDVQVTLMDPSARTAAWFARPSGRVEGANGEFEVKGVLPGSYVATAMWFDQENNEAYTARLPVTVGDAGLEGVELVIERGLDVWGTARVEGAPAETPGARAEGDGQEEALDLTELRVGFQPKEEGVVIFSGNPGFVKEDGSFTLQNTPRLALRVLLFGSGGRLPGNYYLKEARVDGNDVLEEGLDLSAGPPRGQLELVVSPNGGQVEGVALKDQKPFSGATVALVPEEKRRGRRELYKTATTDQYGRFTLRGIPPGEYKLFAWEEIEQGAYQDAEFLKPYEKLGHEVKVEEGSRLSAELKLIPAGDPPR